MPSRHPAAQSRRPGARQHLWLVSSRSHLVARLLSLAGVVGDDLAVSQLDHPWRRLGQVAIVGDQHHRLAVLRGERPKQLDDLLAEQLEMDLDHAVRAATCTRAAVGAGALDFAAGWALVSVADESPFDIGAIECLMCMESAELRAESTLIDIRRRQKQVHAIGISRQSPARKLRGNGRGNLTVSQSGALE